MLRAIASVILGYIVMAVIVFGGLTAAYLAMGTDKAFKPNSFDVSTIWIIVAFIVGMIAALLGGLVSRKIARTGTPPKVLAGIVLVLGLLMAFGAMNATAPTEPRPATMSNIDAMQKAQTPAWIQCANGVIGCVGVLIGAGLVKSRPAVSPAA
ncbi:MAG: hypothetical protein IT435_03270 [Phycisphaerales bacterium]|nr:hypothetical protein [Phycisphaerales bacterium]